MCEVVVYQVEYQRGGNGQWLPWSTERTREGAAEVAARALARWADATRIVEIVYLARLEATDG